MTETILPYTWGSPFHKTVSQRRKVRHDPKDEIHQYSCARSRPRAGVLRQYSRVYTADRSADGAWTALGRGAPTQGRDGRRTVQPSWPGGSDRNIHRYIFGVRRCAEDV